MEAKEDSFVRMISSLEAAAAKSVVPPVQRKAEIPKLSKIQDTSPVVDFLQGKKCLTGVS